MDRYKHLNQVAHHCPVDLYLAGGGGRIYWPFRLQPANESTPSVRENSTAYIIDSGFQANSISNQDVIETARQRHADFVIPDDTISDSSIEDIDAIKQTAKDVSQFLDQVEQSRFSPTVLIPLQPPHDRHYEFLLDEYPRQASYGHFALGGMKRPLMTPDEQLEQIRKFRGVAGYSHYCHALGVGPSPPIQKAVRTNPGLVDAIDCSTLVQDALNGKVQSHIGLSQYISPAQGEAQSTTHARFIEGMLADYCRAMAPSLTDESDIGLDEAQTVKFEQNSATVENTLKACADNETATWEYGDGADVDGTQTGLSTFNAGDANDESN